MRCSSAATENIFECMRMSAYADICMQRFVAISRFFFLFRSSDGSFVYKNRFADTYLQTFANILDENAYKNGSFRIELEEDERVERGRDIEREGQPARPKINVSTYDSPVSNRKETYEIQSIYSVIHAIIIQIRN